MFAAKKLQGAGGTGGAAVDPDFNSVSFLSHFDGANNGVNNVFLDSSASASTITVASGSPTQGSFGPFARPDGEWGVSFGSGNYLTAPAHADFTVGTGDFTVEFWIHPTDFSESYMPVVAIGGASGGLLILKSIAGGTGFGAYALGVSEAIIRTSTLPQLNSWTHVLLSRSGTSVKLFYNGVEEASSTSSYNFSAGELTVGSYGAYTRYWSGNIADLRYVKGTATVTSNFTPPTAPLTAITNTKLLICQSNRFVDNSASAHTITAFGNAAVTPFSPFAPTEVYDPAVNGASYYALANTYSKLDTGIIALPATGNFTLEGWLYATGGGTVASGDCSPINQYNGGVGRLVIEHTGAGSTNGPKKIRLWYNGGVNLISPNSYDYFQWLHVAITRSGSTFNLYVNGISVASGSSSSPIEQTNIRIGGHYLNGYNFTGYISDVRANTSVVYTGNFTPPTAPLTAITNTNLLVNMANGQAIDSAAQNNLTLFGNAKISSTQSKFGGTSMYFDGTGDYATLPASSQDLGSGNFTIEAWVYTASTAQQCVVGAVTNGNGVGSWMFNISHNSYQIRFFCRYNGGTVLDYNAGSGTMTTNSWNHIAVTRDGANLRAFKNGVQLGTTNTTLGSFAIDNAYVNGGIYYIGQTTDAASTFNGYIDDIRISKMARYTSNFTPPSAPFPDIGE